MGKTKYWLGTKVAKHITRPSVYQYLNGKIELTGRNIEFLLDALDLEVTERR